MSSKLSLILYTAFLLTIFVLAYLRLIPTELNIIPFYDSIGHFTLYGIWAYLFARAFSQPVLLLGRFRIQLGIFIIIPIALVEESLQSLSRVRTFSLFDFGWGMLGILIAGIILDRRQNGYQEQPVKRK
jgi:VanZ family protein